MAPTSSSRSSQHRGRKSTSKNHNSQSRFSHFQTSSRALHPPSENPHIQIISRAEEQTLRRRAVQEATIEKESVVTSVSSPAPRLDWNFKEPSYHSTLSEPERRRGSDKGSITFAEMVRAGIGPPDEPQGPKSQSDSQRMVKLGRKNRQGASSKWTKLDISQLSVSSTNYGDTSGCETAEGVQTDAKVSSEALKKIGNTLEAVKPCAETRSKESSHCSAHLPNTAARQNPSTSTPTPPDGNINLLTPRFKVDNSQKDKVKEEQLKYSSKAKFNSPTSSSLPLQDRKQAVTVSADDDMDPFRRLSDSQAREFYNEIHQVFGPEGTVPYAEEPEDGDFDGQCKFFLHPNCDVSARQWTRKERGKLEWITIGMYSISRRRIEGALNYARLHGKIARAGIIPGSLSYFRALALQRCGQLSESDSSASSRRNTITSPAQAIDHPEPHPVTSSSIIQSPPSIAANTGRDPSTASIANFEGLKSLGPKPPTYPRLMTSAQDPQNSEPRAASVKKKASEAMVSPSVNKARVQPVIPLRQSQPALNPRLSSLNPQTTVFSPRGVPTGPAVLNGSQTEHQAQRKTDHKPLSALSKSSRTNTPTPSTRTPRTQGQKSRTPTPRKQRQKVQRQSGLSPMPASTPFQLQPGVPRHQTAYAPMQVQQTMRQHENQVFHSPALQQQRAPQPFTPALATMGNPPPIPSLPAGYSYVANPAVRIAPVPDMNPPSQPRTHLANLGNFGTGGHAAVNPYGGIGIMPHPGVSEPQVYQNTMWNVGVGQAQPLEMTPGQNQGNQQVHYDGLAGSQRGAGPFPQVGRQIEPAHSSSETFQFQTPSGTSFHPEGIGRRQEQPGSFQTTHQDWQSNTNPGDTALPQSSVPLGVSQDGLQHHQQKYEQPEPGVEHRFPQSGNNQFGVQQGGLAHPAVLHQGGHRDEQETRAENMGMVGRIPGAIGDGRPGLRMETTSNERPSQASHIEPRSLLGGGPQLNDEIFMKVYQNLRDYHPLVSRTGESGRGGAEGLAQYAEELQLTEANDPRPWSFFSVPSRAHEITPIPGLGQTPEEELERRAAATQSGTGQNQPSGAEPSKRSY